MQALKNDVLSQGTSKANIYKWRVEQLMNANQLVRALDALIKAFDELQIPYYIGGSVASSLYGEPRQTQDADVVADIQLEQVHPLVQRLEADYYIDADMIRDAILHRSSFNIVYLDAILKIDVFIPKSRQFAQQEQLRSRPQILVTGSRPFLLSSPEDVILNKLEWYKMGNEISTRQWDDVLGVLSRQRTSLDLAYLQDWAKSLGVDDLLERALTEIGFNRD